MKPNVKEMPAPRPTPAQIIAAVGELGLCRYFPSGDAERKALMRLIAGMVSTKPQLDWLISTMVNRVGEWKGAKELRGVFCTRFPPADGISADCIDTIGFTPGELESGSIEKHEERKALTSGRETLRLAAPAGLEAVIPAIAEDMSMELSATRQIRTTSPRRVATAAEVQRTAEALRAILGEGA